MDNQTLPSVSLPRVSAEFTDLSDLLTVACGLIEIEAHDHEQLHRPTDEQRKRIAVTLHAFVQRARTALKGAA